MNNAAKIEIKRMTVNILKYWGLEYILAIPILVTA
jgi:hypothetical protein